MRAGIEHGVELYERLMHVVETMGRVAVGRRGGCSATHPRLKLPPFHSLLPRSHPGFEILARGLVN